MTTYHMPESKVEHALYTYLSNVSALSTCKIMTKMDEAINTEANKDKSAISIFVTECSPDEDYLGNWNINGSVMILTPMTRSNNTSNIDTHDSTAGIVTDELSKLLNNGCSTLSSTTNKLTVQFFKFGNRQQYVDGDYIATNQTFEMFIVPS